MALRRVKSDSAPCCFFSNYLHNACCKLAEFWIRSRNTTTVWIIYNVVPFGFAFQSLHGEFISAMLPTPTHQYSSDLISSLRYTTGRLQRSARKLLFFYGLWCPAYARQRDQLAHDRDRVHPYPSQPTTPPTSPSIPTPSGVRLATWNIRSLRSKYLAVADTIQSNNIDLLVITESWHRSSTDVALCRSTPPDFSFIDRPRPGALDMDSRGGGLVIFYRNSLRIKKINLSSSPTTFEALAASVSTLRGPLTVLAVYRPGSSPPSQTFFDEFATFLEQFVLYNTQIVIAGDLNLHLEDLTSPAANDFRAIAEQFGLTQHVAEPTHRSGGWLDVVITRDDCALTDLQISPPTISDHGLVTATIPFLHDAPSTIIKHVRGWRDLDRDAFKAALMEVPAVADPSTLADLSVEEAFATYEATMTGLIDRFLPLRPARVRRCPLSPWFDKECRSLRRQARRHERKYRRTRLPSDRSAWVQFVRNMHRQYREKERTYWETRIASHAREPKRLWATFDALLGRCRPPNDPLFTADDFLASYTAKILDVRRATENSSPPQHSTTDCRLPTLNTVTSEELRRLVLASPPKSCELDPLPTFLLQEYVDVLLPLLTVLCNRSIQDGVLPPSQKRSILIPVLKSDGLDPSDPANYRPIANVSFLSKVIEKIVAGQLITYLDGNNLLPSCQSGFRKFHSTETLLLRLLSDIYGAIDRSAAHLAGPI